MVGGTDNENPAISNSFELTSSFDSAAASVGRLASFGATMLLKFNCFSGGGPFFGCPRTITESPLITCLTVARNNVVLPLPTVAEPPLATFGALDPVVG